MWGKLKYWPIRALCSDCNCNKRGSDEITCNSDFQCNCKTNYKGLTCDTCNDNYFNFPTCQSCQCNRLGSVSLQCSSNGICDCQDGYNGQKCSECAKGFEKSESGVCVEGKSCLWVFTNCPQKYWFFIVCLNLLHFMKSFD